jgi:uncharacterized FlaG/YvyC family protein
MAMGSNNINFEVERISVPEVRPMEMVPQQASSEGKSAAEANIKKAEQKQKLADIQSVNRDSIQLVRDEVSGRSYVQVMDKKGEVVYQIPPEELQKLQRLLDHLNGNVVDTVA